MNNLLNKIKKKNEYSKENEKILSRRLYNTLLGVMILYGLILNYLLCVYGLEFTTSTNPLLLMLCYFLLGTLGIIISVVSQKSSVIFIGYNLLAIPSGLLLTIILEEYVGIDTIIVKQALLYTSIICVVMVLLGTLYPKFFEKKGGILFIELAGLLTANAILFIYNIDNVIFSWVAAIIYSLYIGYDIYMSQKLKKTVNNAIISAISIYLNIVVVFINILDIFERKKQNNN